MASTKELERLSVPTSIASGFSPSSPIAAPVSADTASASGHDNSLRDHLAILARSVSVSSHNSHHSRRSHRNSVSSSHHSVSSIRSQVSNFQNVRFDPDPIKDISFWGGLALLISNMTGPGIVTLPIVAQSAGWLPTILAFLIVGILSTLSSLFICEAMTEVPGNEYFQSNVEFSNLVLCFFGRRYHLLVQIICFLAMQTTNIASIAISAQLFDNLLIQIFHRTCGIQVYPTAGFVCVTEQLTSASPFTGVMIMTAGVLLAFSMILPLGLLKLSENIWVQLASFVLILLIVLQWIVTFFIHGLDTTLVPAVGSDVSQTFGTILFNYAFITTVPSWANAKQPSVSIHKTVGWGVGVTTIIYIMVAILGGMAFQIPSNSSLIQAISSSPDVTILSQITGYTFPIAALITSIPINIIVIRYNLIQSGSCNMLWANILSGVMPWLIAIPCMTGSGLTTVINWSSLFLVSTANFIIPFVLYIYSKRHKERLSKLPIIEMEQQARISRELSRSSFSGHSRRNTSVSDSIHRRAAGSSFHLRSQSHPDLTIAPLTGIAAATVIPVAVGIGSSSLVSRYYSEENLAGEVARSGTHRRYHTHHPTTSLGPSSATDAGELISGPYFSFSRDGELFEREPSTENSIEHSQLSASHRPSGGSTVILHNPVTEMAQRKAPLPRRVSNKDKLLSMISDKHKRAMEQQAKKIQEQQNGKPVPPMILLSQSTAPEVDDEDLDEEMDVGVYVHSNDSYESETYSEKDANTQSKDIDEANSNLSAALKKLKRRSSVIPASHNSRSTLTLPPSSPPPRLNTSFLELRGKGDYRPGSPYLDTFEHTLEPSPTFNSPGSPASPQKSAPRCTPTSSPGRSSPGGIDEHPSKPSISLSAGSPRDLLRPELPVTDSTRLGPGTGSTPGGMAPQHSPSTPDSVASNSSMERRVSFSNEQRPTVSTPELEHRPSFSDDTKRAAKTAVSTLTGGSPRAGSSPRLGSSPGSNRSSKDGKVGSQEWKMKLLGDHQEVDEGGCGDGQNEEDGEKETMGPELSLADIHHGFSEQMSERGDDARRDSLGRMAAAFVSQPGSFSIRTAPLNLSTPSVLQEGGAGLPHSNLGLSPSAPPPTFNLSQAPPGRNHGMTVSAAATLQDKENSAQDHKARSQSTHQLAVPESANSLANRLSPPSPSFVHRAAFDASSPTSAVAKDAMLSLAPSAPPSPQKPQLHHRTSTGAGRNIRHSGSGKTLAAPFQSGNNYSIPGFSSNHAATSPVFPPSSPGQYSHDPPQSSQGGGSSWFNRRRHSRDPSRSSAASGGMPYSASSAPPSPHTSAMDAGGVGKRDSDYLHEPTTPGTAAALASAAVAAAEAADIAEMERRESYLHESNFHLPQYALGNGPSFEAMWSLRAIPRWIPVSGLKIAWGSLSLLVVAISATIVYDFVQLGVGNDVMSGS